MLYFDFATPKVDHFLEYGSVQKIKFRAISTDSITLRYASPSSLDKKGETEQLFLAKYSEIEKRDAPCYFWGKLIDPYMTARNLIALSNVVQSSFNLSPFELAKLKDPIVTAGNQQLRFEGFSHCAGVYARVDILPGGHDGEFLENGTTNVDFNPPMIASLARVQKAGDFLLSIGKKEISVQHNNESIVERKVPLPAKWIKGLTTVQVFLAETEEVHEFTRVEALQLFQTLPTGRPKEDYYLVNRGNKPQFTPGKSASAICIGGVHRLKLLEPLIPFISSMKAFAHPAMQSTTWQLYFGNMRFCLSLSRDTWRGFSGEGAALESLIEAIPDAWIDAADKYGYANQAFNAALVSVEENIPIDSVDKITMRLSAMGLLGYDLDENGFFYRRLPFKLNRIIGLNPRMKEADRLLAEDKVEIIAKSGDRIEARVEGSGVHHVVIIDGERERCTCTWFSRHQGERGPCKHLLAVKKKLKMK